MTLWHRRGVFAAGAVALGGAALAVRGRAVRAQTVVAPPGSTVVITPPPPAATAPGAAGRNIADTLAADGRFNRLLELLRLSGTVDQLRGAGPFTILAPTDAAFQGAPSAMLQDLVGQPSGGGIATGSPDPVRLGALVQYHIIPGVPYGTTLPAAGDQRIRTLNGSDVRIEASGGPDVSIVNPAPGLQPGGFGAAGANAMPPAHMAGPAILASNGVIWPITGVLFP
ncbi:MAG: fasciclin domain-containing protein [Acetobacteraceae bacterium]|nr:fasciclin domain-containing protein [Acetobacteraceae bacterium]